MTVMELDNKLSKNHRLVFDIIQEGGLGRHLSMAEVYEIARERRPGIGFTTVYRAITRLRAMSAISEIILPGADSAYYEPMGAEHAHFRCSSCGSISDVELTIPVEVAALAGARLGAHVEGSAVSLRGRCKNCL